MKFGKIGVAVISLVPFNVYGECTPTPDCASIGYTETSCETISIKCPFDQSKLYCFPCDSAYQYPCSEPNEYGEGVSCNNKYKSCCNTSCVVGAIYYSDGTCNTCLDNNKSVVGIVVKDNELVMNNAVIMSFSPDDVNILGIPDITDVELVKADYNGFENTAAIVAHYGEDADISETGVGGVYCYNYAPVRLEGSKNKWYLPAVGELYGYVYRNWDILNKTLTLLNWSYLNKHSSWSSNEYNDEVAWFISVRNGGVWAYYNDNICGHKSSGGTTVVCFLNIK